MLNTNDLGFILVLNEPCNTKLHCIYELIGFTYIKTLRTLQL